MGEEDDPRGKLPRSVRDNIGTIAEHCARYEQRMSSAQVGIEKLSLILGSPAYVVGNVVFVVCWIAANLVAPEFGYKQIDEPPFFWLQGLVALNAFIISTTVLIRQNRVSKLAEHNAHLDLQVSLLTEEKTSKIIALLEELRHDMPNVHDKIDPEAEELSQPTDTKTVLSAIESDRD